MKRRNLILLLGGASSGALSVGTGAFSSAQVERGVNVNVTNDKDAFVRYEKPSDGMTIEQGGERITLVRIRNQFGGNQKIALVGVEVEIYDDDDILNHIKAERKLPEKDGPDDPSEVDPPDESMFEKIEDVRIVKGSNTEALADANENEAFGPGGWARVVADANLDPGDEADVEVTITVKGIEGTGVTAQLFGDTRSFTIEGEGPNPIEDLTFNGARNANVDGASGEYTLDLWLVDKDDPQLEDYIQQDRSWNGKGNINSGDADENSDVKNRRLLAVRFRETDQTFYRPDCGVDEADVPWDVRSFIMGEENGSSACGSD